MDHHQGESHIHIEGDAARMRVLAARPLPTGRARLCLSRGAARRLEALLDAARRLLAVDGAENEALSKLAREGRVIAACARQAASELGERLPARGGRTRIGAILAGLCDGDAPLTRERLMAALEAFDAAQGLTMAELWAVPRAARVVLSREMLRVAEGIVARARTGARAARWAQRGGRGAFHAEPAFIEAALKRIGEDGLAAARERLDARMSRSGLSPERAVMQAQAARARDALRLENLLAARRMLDGLNWQAGFRALSQVDRALRGAGVYGRMDDASRAAVRAQVAVIARRLRVPEAVVARHAADAARQDGGLSADACWWLYDDAGRRALSERMGKGKTRLPKLVPDPTGAYTIAAHVALSALLAAGLALLSGCAWLLPACTILGWTSAGTLIGQLYPRLFPPARLLKMELDVVPDDCRTLVTMPVLLSSEARVDAVCDQLEALGCLEPDPNIEYLLLGDFADAPRRDMPGDEAILNRARARIAAMNARAGREKYALLHRQRAPLAADGIWMGRDRKRGALMALNRLLLGEDGAESAFAAEGTACARLRGRFRYVLTLDADTRLLPEDVRRLIGAMAHPLNRPGAGRGFAVLQPRMEPLPSACVNGFVRLFGGVGGVNAYPVSVSNLWQDATGRGIFAGKGIYDVAAFAGRVDGALPEGRVLSHDLIEGALAGAGLVSDIAFYDGYPTTLPALLRRLHRWTRGDWQLLPLMKLPGLTAADRFRMLDNLVRSLRAPTLLMLVVAAAWTGDGALLCALAVNYLEPILNPGARERLWRRATAELAILPALAWCSLDAIVRTLWRLYVSGKHLLEWVTAADAEHDAASNRCVAAPCRAAAALTLPGILGPAGAVALALAALFLVAPGWVRDMEGERLNRAEPLPGDERRLFMEIARDTWRFFETTLPLDGNGLPPDNVQLDPPVGAARRTSPTNVALYLLSCVSAARLGFIGVGEARSRMATAVGALERMDKWRGHPFNWVDIDALKPLSPRYVSSVDSGNLAAALLACARAPEAGDDLAARMRRLAADMDFAALYDDDRELFAIGMDVDAGRMSRSHYDLLASESRILSYAAMMLGKVPARHWRRLGRPCAAVGDGVAPLSWSGTMFEYLMPALWMDAPVQTLLGEGVRAAVAAQIVQGRRAKRPWGVSESGCAALDAALNYQYRAFGLPNLALSGESEAGVVAPYAAALAAMVAPREAAGNLRRMAALGWRDERGFYEAADYLRPGEDGAPALVKSHMAHHQGMILCALCNVLTDNSLRRDFMGIPEARALSLLLEERACDAPRRRKPPRERANGAPPPRLARLARADCCVPETHILFGGGATALYTSDGAVHYRRFGVDATRFAGSLQDRADRACVHLRELDAGGCAVLGGDGSRTQFEPGVARTAMRLGKLEAEMSVCVSPEDGTLLRVVRLRNAGERPLRLSVTDVVPVALAKSSDWRAHAIFENLFVESVRLSDDALLFRRRPGSRGADGPKLAHMIAANGPVAFETNYECLVGREGDSGRPGGVAKSLTGALGATLNPVSALAVELELAPGERTQVYTALALLDGSAPARAWLDTWRQPDQPERALRLAGARARAALGFMGLSAGRWHTLDRAAALLADGHLSAQARGMARGEDGVSRASLWALGISGHLPMLALSVRRAEDASTARELIRTHGFYRAAGIATDLILIDDGEGGYARPVRDALEALLAASHLNALCGEAGGAWLLDGRQLTPAQRRALRRGAAAWLDGGGDLYGQLRGLLSRVEAPRGRGPKPMTTGASTLKPERRIADNGLGGFLPEGGYSIDVRAGALPPAPWCNLLANDRAGLLLSERGGGFFWRGNSRTGRLTPYFGDALREGWGLMLYLTDGRGEFLPLLPGECPAAPFRARYDADAIRYAFETRRLAGEVRFAMRGDLPEIDIDVALDDRGLRGESFALVAFVDWLMGEDRRDSAWLNAWHDDGACMASGAGPGVGWLAALDAGTMPGPGRCAFLGRGTIACPEGLDLPGRGEGWTLRVPLRLKRGESASARFVLGWSEDAAAARSRVNALRTEPQFESNEPPRLTIDTPDEALNHLFNDFLLHQVRAARVQGRAGLYQPGGAYGFRDQLQDMLALLHDEPARVRAHLLRCAARQFAAGDVMHWWHEPSFGVRTRVSDDLLFLPWVTAAYVRHTGDTSILEVVVPFLEDVDIPAGQSDVCKEMKPSGEAGTLHAHCMRAFRRAARTGTHGLLLMGAGDWNDGMSRVGAAGKGESVWLSQFAIACADAYRAAIDDVPDRAWLEALARKLRIAVEVHGWDGGWYLRAYDDAGAPLGSARNRECRIDAISQAWAELAGLDGARCRMAMDAAWDRLVDGERGLIRLLTPPFDGRGADPGYIRAYPPGVRENGGQYTHGALWLLLALIRMGDAERAHRALQMLAPYNHADSPEKARRYRVEPYVMAADVYDRPGQEGRGGWTWYTGAAGWMYTCILELLGYERRGDRVRLNALLGDWPRAAVTMPFGSSTYRLACEKTAARATLDGVETDGEWITMVDDGRTHEAVFPPRSESRGQVP